jgi:hypothetical protein
MKDGIDTPEFTDEQLQAALRDSQSPARRRAFIRSGSSSRTSRLGISRAPLSFLWPRSASNRVSRGSIRSGSRSSETSKPDACSSPPAR